MSMRVGSDLPDLEGATEWINGAVRRDDLLGAPALVHFWAMSCRVCKSNIETLNAWRDKYTPLGLRMVAVHMPRSRDDHDIAKVRQDIVEFGLTDPCAIDNNLALKAAFENDHGYVPAYFLFDAEGKLRNRAAGDAGLPLLEAALKRLMDSHT